VCDLEMLFFRFHRRLAAAACLPAFFGGTDWT
jgi:hypothetical protein